MNKTLRTYLKALMGAERWRVVWTLFLMVLCSLTEGAGIALLLPVLQVAGVKLGNQTEVSHYVRMFSDALRVIGLRPTLLTLLGMIVIVTGGRTLLGRMQSVAIFAVEQNFVHSLRQRVYRAIENANWLFLSRSRSTDFTHVLTAELMRVGQGTYVLLTLAGSLVIGAVYIGIAAELSWQITLIVVVAGAVLVMALRGKTRALHGTGSELSDAMNQFYASTIEHLQSLKSAKAYAAQERNLEIFLSASRRVTAAYMNTARQQASTGAWFEAGSMGVLCVGLYVAIQAFAVPSAIIMILLLLFARVVPQLMSMHQQYRNLVWMLPAFARVMELEERCKAAAEFPYDLRERLQFRAMIRFERVTFSYRHNGAPAVHDIGLVIPAGRKVAIVGSSGAGKSTLADLVMGLLTPDSGTITIDGEPLTARNVGGWRQHIGYVAQENNLFHLSVRQNLLWARPDASEAELIGALRLAAAEEFTMALPQGLDTVVGERGILISQGERQRLALARALLRNPSLLILDEATNSLDSDNENKILSAIQQLRAETTVLLIAHRLSTIQWADLIYVVENGTIVECGAWEELNARRDGRFRALCEAQSLAIETREAQLDRRRAGENWNLG